MVCIWFLTCRKEAGTPIVTSSTTSPRTNSVLPDFRNRSFPRYPSEKSRKEHLTGSCEHKQSTRQWSLCFIAVVIYPLPLFLCYGLHTTDSGHCISVWVRHVQIGTGDDTYQQIPKITFLCICFVLAHFIVLIDIQVDFEESQLWLIHTTEPDDELIMLLIS